ncbi:MAG: hypothetical protein C4289_00535 [Chloroflexota bacterium]
MKWLRTYVRTPKDASYSARVLEHYRLGMRARGAIRGVRILTGSDSCPVCRAYAGTVYHPDEAPVIPIAGCTHPQGCRCAYIAAMTYDFER